MDRPLNELVLYLDEEKESKKNWVTKSKKGQLFRLTSEQRLTEWAIDIESTQWNKFHIGSIKPSIDSFIVFLMEYPPHHYSEQPYIYANFFQRVKSMVDNQSNLSIKVENIEERLKRLEKNQLEEKTLKIEELKTEISEIKDKLKNTIIFKPILEEPEESKKFIEEETFIEEQKKKHEGELLAFTRKDDKLFLVAHALFEKDLMELISEARKKNQISKKDKIFYR